MSDIIKKQKDIVENNLNSYSSATSAYSDYFNGESPTYIVFYQINDEASRTDSSLEDTHEIVGGKSSLYYNRISNIPVYGLNSLDISQQLAANGVQDFITGDFVILPNLNLNPRPGELFTITDSSHPELSTHLFIIDDTQPDRAASGKYYKCSYKLYPSDADNIYSHVVKKYVYDPTGAGNTEGVGDSVLITEEASANAALISAAATSLAKTYEDLFYNSSMDTFTYQKKLDQGGNSFAYYWCPYVCHFLYKNSVLQNINTDFLQEIYIQDINESEFPAIYSEKGYRSSLFHAVESKSTTLLNYKSSFLEVSAYDLNAPLNLPFFTTAEKYYLVDTYYDTNLDFWLGAFHLLYGNEDHLYDELAVKPYIFENSSIKDYFASLHLSDTSTEDDVKDAGLIPGSFFYQVDNLTTAVATGPKAAYYMDDNLNISSANIIDILAEEPATDITEDNVIITILQRYFKGNLSALFSTVDTTDDDGNLTTTNYAKNTCTLLENAYYENNMANYILIPLIIYILQNYKS